MDLIEKIDLSVLHDMEHFFIKIHENALYQRGVLDVYDDGGEPALGTDVEYFLPIITADDRMNYIARNIVSIGDDVLSPRNKICNTIISHFYGARGIHQTITMESDPTKAHIDFERFNIDKEYRLLLRENLLETKLAKIPIYGSTELRTSLFGAANSYCLSVYEDPTLRLHPGNILEWVSSFIPTGIIDRVIQSQSLEETVGILSTLPGVGNYYSYHSATSNSVNPQLNFNHDEEFVLPGPGCCKTLAILFPELSKKDCSLGDQVVWLRNNQEELFPNFQIHEEFHNILDHNGKDIFTESQNELKNYTMEVGLCQYSVYVRLRDNPELIGRRKVARVEHQSDSLNPLINF